MRYTTSGCAKRLQDLLHVQDLAEEHMLHVQVLAAGKMLQLQEKMLQLQFFFLQVKSVLFLGFYAFRPVAGKKVATARKNVAIATLFLASARTAAHTQL